MTSSSSSPKAYSSPSSESLTKSAKTPSLPSPQPAPTCQTSPVPSLNSSIPSTQQAQSDDSTLENRTRRRSSRGVKGATATQTKTTGAGATKLPLTTSKSPDSVKSAAAGKSTRSEDQPTTSVLEASSEGVDRGLLTSMTEFIESLVESSQTKKKQQRRADDDVIATSTTNDTDDHSLDESALRASKRSTRSLGKTANSKPARIGINDVPSTVGDQGEEASPPKKDCSWVERESEGNVSASGNSLAPKSPSESAPPSSVRPVSPSPSFPPSAPLDSAASLTPIPSPTETNSVGGGESSSTSNDAAESGVVESARKDHREDYDENRANINTNDSLLESSSSASIAADIFKADYAKALAFSPPRLDSSSCIVASCFSSPLFHHNHSALALGSPPTSNHLFPAPPKLKLTSSPSGVSSSFSTSSFAKAPGFSSHSPSFSSFSITTAPSPENGVVSLTSPMRGRFMNPLEIRVQDVGGVGGEGDLVNIATAAPALLLPNSPRRTGGGGASISPRASWKSPKKTGKTKNRQSRR